MIWKTIQSDQVITKYSSIIECIIATTACRSQKMTRGMDLIASQKFIQDDTCAAVSQQNPNIILLMDAL